MIANSRQKLFSADSPRQSSFLKQQYKQMMPHPLQSHPSVCDFYAIYAAFHLINFQQEENTGFDDINVLYFKSNYMW